MNLFDLTDEVAVVIGATECWAALWLKVWQKPALGAVLGRNASGRSASNRFKPAAARRAFSVDALERQSLAKAHEETTPFGPASNSGERRWRERPEGYSDRGAFIRKNRAEDWRGNFDLNLAGGVLLPCQEFGPAMVGRGNGSIVNIASVSGHVPLSRVVPIRLPRPP
jgi:NAD(P)-dependent dehydrogenase (short-subunit alcohol dehydrogenase family)